MAWYYARGVYITHATLGHSDLRKGPEPLRLSHVDERFGRDESPSSRPLTLPQSSGVRAGSAVSERRRPDARRVSFTSASGALWRLRAFQTRRSPAAPLRRK